MSGGQCRVYSIRISKGKPASLSLTFFLTGDKGPRGEEEVLAFGPLLSLFPPLHHAGDERGLRAGGRASRGRPARVRNGVGVRRRGAAVAAAAAAAVGSGHGAARRGGRRRSRGRGRVMGNVVLVHRGDHAGQGAILTVPSALWMLLLQMKMESAKKLLPN